MEGHVHPDFEPLSAAFKRNIDEGREVGAALAVYRHGELMLDVWGGLAAPEGDAWRPDTMACMMSVAKGVTGLCMAMLYDRGLLDLDAPVADYWPEFAQAGKGDVTVSTALSHRAAIPAFDAAQPGDIYDWNTMVSGLAAQTPYWPPGGKLFYHSATLGFIAGEILRRIDGRSIGTFVREEIAGPLGRRDDRLIWECRERGQGTRGARRAPKAKGWNSGPAWSRHSPPRLAGASCRSQAGF